MKLLKTNILNGKTEKIDSYDAFDEVTINNYGMLQDLGINDFDEFVNAFKKDKELEIAYDSFIITNVPEKTKKGRFTGKYVKDSLKMGKELSTELIENIVDIKHIVKRHEDTMNKDMTYVFKTVLNSLYSLLKLEGYSESHLSKVIYSDTFEHKGIKY